MAASVLNTTRAIQMSVFVVRAFVRLRELAVAHAALSAQLNALERRVTGHDEDLARLVATIRSLLARPVKPPRQIGFTTATPSQTQRRTVDVAVSHRMLPVTPRPRSGRGTIQP